MNAIEVIYPYKYQGLWVFDDERVGLSKEPFIAGADTIIDRFTQEIPHAEEGFRLIFSQFDFPGFQGRFELVRPERGGHVYHAVELDQEGWLCPALMRYFDEPPQVLYARFEAMPTN